SVIPLIGRVEFLSPPFGAIRYRICGKFVFHDKSTALFRELISKYGATIVGPINHIHFRSPLILKVSYCFIALIASIQFFTMNGSVLFIDLTRFSSLYKLKLIGKIL